jgi:hypothetical protein
MRRASWGDAANRDLAGLIRHGHLVASEERRNRRASDIKNRLFPLATHSPFLTAGQFVMRRRVNNRQHKRARLFPVPADKQPDLKAGIRHACPFEPQASPWSGFGVAQFGDEFFRAHCVPLGLHVSDVDSSVAAKRLDRAKRRGFVLLVRANRRVGPAIVD